MYRLKILERIARHCHALRIRSSYISKLLEFRGTCDGKVYKMACLHEIFRISRTYFTRTHTYYFPMYNYGIPTCKLVNALVNALCRFSLEKVCKKKNTRNCKITYVICELFGCTCIFTDPVCLPTWRHKRLMLVRNVPCKFHVFKKTPVTVLVANAIYLLDGRNI